MPVSLFLSFLNTDTVFAILQSHSATLELIDLLKTPTTRFAISHISSSRILGPEVSTPHPSHPPACGMEIFMLLFHLW